MRHPWMPLTAILLILAVVKASSDFRTYYHGLKSDAEPAKVGMSSLTFVFDRTGSMFDDLDQVRKGTEGIFNTVMKQRKRFIYNYVLVMFHDPDVDEPLITTEPLRFQQKLRHVNLSGGQDCPEMTLTGIKKALEASLPGSFIYVFTDARSKDFHLIDTVLNLIQEKQSSVVFVMTGDCGDREHEGYKVFDRIASASFGQVFHLQKSQVTQILEYVRHSMDQRKVHLLYEVRETGRSNLNEVPVDSHMGELALSLAITPSIEDRLLDLTVIDPNDQELDIQAFLNDSSTINLNTVKLIRIKDPTPGIWKIKTSSRNRNTLRVFGHGDVDFKYGFTSVQNPNQRIELTQPRPYANQNAYLWVNMTGLMSPGIVERVSLVDYEGKEIYGGPATVSRHNPMLYHVGPFLPPKKNSFFFVRVEGVDEKDFKFVRIAPVATSSVEPGGPKATMLPVTPATLYKPVNLTCNVESSAPFEVHWKHGDRRLTTAPLLFQHSDTVMWPISSVLQDHAGRYFCEVTSAAGNHSAYTDLDMFEPPPDIVSVRNATAVLGKPAMLHCQTQTQFPRYTWFRNGFPIPRGPLTYSYSNGSLVIFNTRREDVGPYVCKVQTKGGTANATIHLSVLETPTSRISPKDIFAIENTYFELTCVTTGIPPPRVRWFHASTPIEAQRSSTYFVDQNNTLRVYTGLNVKGVYECRADNVAGTASDFSTVNIAEKPIINIPRQEYVLGQGENVVLQCNVLGGQPTPKVHWEKNGVLFTTEGIGSSNYIQQKYGNLHIKGASEIDAGEYTCVAENSAGKDSKKTRVNIGIPPNIIISPPKIEATIFKPTHLPCKALGNPQPTIMWFRNGVRIEPGTERFQISSDGTLIIDDVQFEDSGIFVCRASNNYGSQDRSTQLFVIGLEAPVLGTIPPELQVLEGDDVRIDCIVVLGIPTPTRTWMKDGKSIYENLKTFVDGDGSLVIREVSSADEGTYTCQAKNHAGTANQNVRLSLISRPHIEAAGLKGEIEVAPGESLDLPCPVSGSPPPKVAWMLNGNFIDENSNEFSVMADNTLRIHKTGVANSGVFTCKAKNAAGETTFDTIIRISTPPIIAPTQTSFNHIPGDSLILPCEVEGEPRPDIQWYLNGRPAPGTIDHSGSLVIDNINERHTGEYTCVATNFVGKDEITMTVTVHTPPVIDGSDLPKSLVVNVNETIEFPCPARAYPPPQRVWTYEDSRVEFDPQFAGLLESAENGSLFLKAVQPEHEGLYKCYVSNLAGDDYVLYNLKVQIPPRIMSDVPGTVDVVLGVGLEIPCRAVGSPKPQVSWQKNGFEIINDEKIQIDASGTLRIFTPNVDDEGQYKCTAKNPAGEDVRTTNVYVQEPPRVMPGQKEQYTYIQGETATLTCDVRGSPNPTYRWFRGEEEVTMSTARHEMNSDGTLIVGNVGKNDNVIYRCLAENVAGSAQVSMKLNVIVPPEITDPDVVDRESVRINDPFSLYCPVISHPLPKIYWQMNDRLITEGDSNIIFNDDKRRLRVIQSRITDAGIYKCIARNPAGESSKTFEVEVLIPPQKDDSVYSTKISGLEHQRIEIGCPVTGIPAPEIEWYVNMVPLKPGERKNGVFVSLNGEKVLIEDALVEHQGTFTCVATSKAGSLPIDIELSVLGKPQVGENETIHAVLDKSTTLNCDVQNEGPKSSIIWLFNGKETLPPEAQLAPNSKKLVLLKTGAHHSGTFECLVRNSAGESRKKFDLDVWIRPDFVDKYYEESIQLIAGEEKSLDCRVTGNPTPKVEWKLDNFLISEGLSDDGQVLTIRHSESGRNRYTCVVANEAGSIFRDFVIDTITPPKLVGGSNAVVDIEVIQGHSATLDCPIESDQSTVSLEWLKNGHQIQPGTPKISSFAHGTRLLVSDVQFEDQATFVCVATNPAGRDSRSFRIKVLIPPRLQGSMVEEVDVIEGTELELQCLYVAEPRPDILWTKNNHPLGEHITLLNEQRTVYIEEAQKSDAGAYKCRMTNTAGMAEKTFNVRVISKPVLLGSNETTVVEALLDAPQVLECPLPGDLINPNVELYWTKNKLPLLPEHFNQGIQILSNGKHLHIPHVQLTDDGTFACVAKNEAGETAKNYQLKVLVRPKILSPHGDFKVIENNTLVLPCEVEGSPQPSIEWTKDDRPATHLPNVQVLSDGQQFKILAAQEEHRGTYVCTAANKVGKIDINFDVDVITRPTVVQQVRDVIEVVQGQKAHFVCEVKNPNFVGEITWMKNYEPITESAKFTITNGNRKLILNNAELKDEASYSCRARNDAGSVSLNYRLEVLVPPKIIMLDKDKNRTVVENSTLSLSCPATGKPDPVISWFKDGEMLTKENVGHRIKSGQISGNDLKVARIVAANGGSFSCSAVNKAGTADQDVFIDVMTPPKIVRENISSEIEAKSGDYAEIYCYAIGRPTPTITWLKAGRPLDLSRDVYMSSNQMRLHFTHFHEKNADKYTCIARNAAGEDKRDFTARLLKAPKIDSTNLPRNISMNAGRTATLNCPATGSPEPSIYWLRDGLDLPNDGRFILLNGGKQLQIRDLEENDSGRFICFAENRVGLSDLSFDLKVIGAPEIKGPPVEEVHVLLNQAKELRCDVTGSAPISISWLKEDRLVNTDLSGTGNYLQSTNQGQRMHILSAQKSDNARFTCIAKNPAGEARKHFDVVVQIPPTINDTLSSSPIQSVIPGSDFKIDCRVDAFPVAEIIWLKDGIPVYPDEMTIMSNDNQTLYVRQAADKHGGTYTCVPRNIIGETSRNYLINLAAPPIFEQGTETLDVNVGSHVSLTCRTSSGTGTIQLNWKINNRPAPNGNFSQTVHIDGAKVLINKIRFSDAGEYACFAKNEAGGARKQFFINVLEKPRFLDKSNTSVSIIIGRPFTIDCLVKGTPKPTVTWIKDGKVLDDETCAVSENCQFMADHQRLVIDEAGENDAGRYSCVAENVPGRDEKDIVVSLLRPPKMRNDRLQVEVAQNEAQTLTCPIDDRSVQIQWFKDELPVRSNSRVQILNSGRTLHIMNADSSDSASYSCLAKNEAGDDTAYFDLLVLVKPEITGLHPRTIDSISNQTVPIHCRTTGIPPPSIEWYFSDKRIDPSEKYEIVENGTVLRIHNIQSDEAGRYSCVARNKIGEAQTDVFIEVTEAPTFIGAVNEIKIIEGTEKTIRCDVKGKPYPTVTWRKNGEPVGYGLISRGGENLIHIVKARVEDAGRYTCIAMNRGGERRHNMQVHVLVPPKIADGDRVLKAVEGNLLVLECPANGIPPPEITWLKNGNKLNVTGSSLSLPNLSVADDTKYTCEARNEAGSASADYVVDVLIKPRIRDVGTEIRVVEGEKARLECKADGNPPPTVQWLRGGRPITDMNNFLLSPLGESLMVLKARTTDAGGYSCLAKNSAGETEKVFTMTVLTAPYLNEAIDQNPRVISGKSVILHCPVRGNPAPEVSWRFNGKDLRVDGSQYVREPGNNDLEINNVQTSTAGRYTCHATNEVGLLDTEYVLDVIAPPKFASSGQNVYEVLAGDSITMSCPLEAYPQPEITWLRAGNPVYLSSNVVISADGQKLTIKNAALEDNGKYTCSATNMAGTTDVDVLLKVYVPPTIDESNLIENPLAVLGKAIYLECPADGIPQPTVTWMRNGRPVPLGGRYVVQQNNITFGILNVQASDMGKYSCLAENKGGKAEEHFDLHVLAPPELLTTEAQKITKREDDQVTLLCPVKQVKMLDPNEERDVTWTKDGRSLIGTSLTAGAENGDGRSTEKTVSLSKDGYRLTISNLKLVDAGDYRCLVTNRAGEVQGKFILEILSKPVIDTTRNSPESHVIQGRPFTVHCPVSGYPLPTIRWFKDRKLVNPDQDPSIRILDNGQALEILSAGLVHKGIWTCEAENDAGDSEIDVKLDIWTMPKVKVKPTKEGAVRPLGKDVTLECQTTGNPPPIVTWQFDGRVLLDSSDNKLISDINKRLVISGLKMEDAGEYLCTAKNEVGVAEDSIKVDILVPSQIDREGVQTNQRLPAGQTLTLFCDAKAKPPPKLRWFVNNTLIRNQFKNIKVGEGGEYLEVSNVSLADKGIYRCFAENPAGNDTLDYKVVVDEKPQILNTGTSQALEGKVAVLVCNATGEPAPKITWLRNGMRLETSVRHMVEKNTLKIVDTRSDSDSGIYLCLAQNEAGSVQQAFTLEVLVAPEIISASPNETVVAVGEPFSLKCGARGHPKPAVTWEFNDEKIETALTTEYRVDEDTLYVKELPQKGTAVFRCTVHNSAGLDEIEYVVKAIAPPTVNKEGIQTLNVTENEPTIIFCDIDVDLKESEIIWNKNGGLIRADGSMEINNNGKQLKIPQTLLKDEGTYTCIARNSAGNANLTTKLFVGVAPKINEDLRKVILKKGEQAELLCEAVGIPKPEITWLKDNKTHVSLPGLESKVLFSEGVEPENAGVYTCKATNWAGTVYKDVDLLVLIPPVIVQDKLNITANVGDSLILPCNASGIPEPVISWIKGPNISTFGDENYQNMGSALAIKKLSIDDDTHFTCTATSEAGQAVATRKVTVLSTDKKKVMWVVCDENGRPIEPIYQQARGDIPDSRNKMEHFENRKSFVNESDLPWRCLPTERSGRTLAEAKDVVPHFTEEPPPLVIKKIGDDLLLRCSAVGSPNPEVYFTKNGQILEQTRDLHGKIEIRKTVEANDFGNYQCIGTNTVGESKVEFVVEEEVLPSPTPGLHELTVLNCLKNGEEQTERVNWKLDRNFVNNLDDSMHSLNNGSLVLSYFAMKLDLDRITCFVNGEPGDGFNSVYMAVDDEVPVVNIRPRRIFSHPTSNVVISCHLEHGNPLTTRIRWSKDNINVSPDDDKFQILANNSLLVKNAALNDRGSFKCRGWNNRGKSWDGVELIIEDAPKFLNTRISGSVNSKRFEEMKLPANFTPSTKSNDITVAIDNLVGNHTTVTKSIMAVVSMPLTVVGYDNSSSGRPVKSRPAKFERVTNYEFESGEKMRVKQKATGIKDDVLNMDVEFDGDLPTGKHHDSIEFESWDEQLVGDSPGHMIGKGNSELKLGKNNNIPVRWYDEIKFDDDEDEFLNRGETMVLSAQPKMNENAVKVEAKVVGRLGRCPDGHTKVNGRCEDVNECALYTTRACKNSGNGSVCVNVIGSYECRVPCAAGFKSNSEGHCVDIDECRLAIDTCGDGEECINTEGSFECQENCADGYQPGDNGKCIDIDECVTNPCEAPTSCKNLRGSFECNCPNGFFKKTGTKDVCEGLISHPEKPLKVLDYAADRHICPDGYYKDSSGNCIDIDECDFDAPCAYNCKNTPGSYECECPDGYLVSGGACVDRNECLEENVCSDDAFCFNELGTFSCLSKLCPEKYRFEEEIMQCIPTCSNCSSLPIIVHMVPIRSGLRSETPLIRLTAYDKQGRILRRSNFRIHKKPNFFLRAEGNSGGSATVFNKYPLAAGSRHQLHISSKSTSHDGKTRYKTEFLVYISVSQYPF